MQEKGKNTSLCKQILMSYPPLSNTSVKIATLSHLKQFHAKLIQSSLHHHYYWVAQLIDLCTRLHAPPQYARCVFNSVHQPNDFVFTNMLKFYSKLGANSDIFNLFDDMQKCNIKPNTCIYPALIKVAGKNGIAFHAHLLKMGLDSDKFIRNAFVNVYGKYGPIGIARELFDEMSERSVADCNVMISAYWNFGDEVEAKWLFDLMPEKNVTTWTAMVTEYSRMKDMMSARRYFDQMPEKNVITWTTMVTGYSRMKDMVNARRYFDQMPEKNVVSWNAILSGYAQNGYAKEALSLFDEMLSVGVSPDDTTWVAVISSCSSCGDPSLVESLVKMMNEKGIHRNFFVNTAIIDMYAKCGSIEMAKNIFDQLNGYRNVVTWNTMISAYTRVGELASARELFDQMPVKNVVSWNSMISGYSQNGQSDLAIELFKEMINKGIMPDEVTVVGVISACGHLGALELGNWVVKFITENQIKLNTSVYNSLIFMYSKCGSMNDAKKFFHEMETRDVISYNTLITGFAAHGNGIETIELLQKMEEEGNDPDRITYIGVLTACSHTGLLEEGQEVFKSIKSPDIDHYACMVDLLGRVGKLNEAKRVIERMPMDPHAGIYGSLLNASRIHKRIDLGEFAANKLFELEPENSGNYVLLSNIYASAGRWEDVERIRALMKKEGVTKTTGWSWTEHGGKIHKFIVGDQSHERSVEIYRVLAAMKKKMRTAGYEADKGSVLRDVEEEEKEEMVGTHSEKLAVAFALLVTEPGAIIRVVKNLRICGDCHTAVKMLSKLEGREIIVRDNNRFHCFENNLCSCKDYW
ncbi:Pentatricopeptide repeat-containing protein [Forsythia ovata]|uniref:Pentatricopeptide repeat-containing protein n=1 Tax=Forsythia ovata TaxID=205694 RepID=A0ABD1VKC6_9LAMI